MTANKLGAVESSNRVNWNAGILAQMERVGFRPFVGYWVRVGDNRLYLMSECYSAVKYDLLDRQAAALRKVH